MVGHRSLDCSYGPGVLLIAAAGCSLLLPISGNGVSGSALRPHYTSFGFSTYEPLPAKPSKEDWRAAGVVLPRDVVAERRRLATGAALVGVVLVAWPHAIRRRRA